MKTLRSCLRNALLYVAGAALGLALIVTVLLGVNHFWPCFLLTDDYSKLVTVVLELQQEQERTPKVPTGERSEELVQEQLDLLETQQAELAHAYEDNQISKSEYERANAKIELQISKIQQHAQQRADRDQERSPDRHRSLFND